MKAIPSLLSLFLVVWSAGACSIGSKTATSSASATTPVPASPTPAPTAAPASGGRQYTKAAVWTLLDPSSINPLLRQLASSCAANESLTRCANETTDPAFTPVKTYFDTLERVRCLNQQDRDACVEKVMVDSGASPEAVAFYKATGWFLREYRPLGLVDLGIGYNVWAANSNEQYVILNGSPSVIFPSTDERPIDVDPAYSRLLTVFTPTPNFPAGQPRIVAWPFDYFFEQSDATASGGQRLVFQFNVANGCHACGTGYLARFGLEFGTDRKLQQTTFLNICRGPHAQTDVTGVSACPPSSPP